ncbi:MAG: phosphatidate cytidylyltransferase, partial [Actinomycetota bacterium]|nr:phosphatidate cytidylyltransferase [Actinomycetota bacterium]
ERGDVAPRRPEGEPRFGDRPASPPEGVRPAVRFPLPPDEEPDRFRPRVTGIGAGPALPHWTEPPTGEVPRILAEDASGDDDEIDLDDESDGEDVEAWSSFATSGPRWRDSAGDWAEPDFDAEAMRHDDSTRVGALDDRDRPAPDDFFFDAPAAREEPPVIRTGVRTTPTPPATSGGDRDMTTAVAIGAGLAVLFLLLMRVGPGAAMLLVGAVLVLAAAELFGALQRGGYQPATLLGLVGVGALSGAAYWKGEAALPLVAGLAIVFSLLWFLVGVTRTAPTMNAGITVFGIMYVGLLGSFAALILRLPNGQGILLGVVIAVVANDVGALVVGRQAGRAPLAPSVSPNKTIEGTVGGSLASILVSFLVLGIIKIHPWDAGSALALGVVIAIAAPLGDLCESMIKRDLGVKDMGAVLPGHGGLLDRFDALLFCLPAVYYLCRVLKIF